MPTTITCNQCGNEIEVTQALSADLEKKIALKLHQDHEHEVSMIREQMEAQLKKKDDDLEESKLELVKKARIDAIEKVRREYDSKIEMTKDEAKEQEKRNEQLQEQLKELMKQLRESRSDKEKIELEYQKKLLEEEGAIRDKAKKEVQEEFSLREAQHKKQLLDLEKQLQDAQRKAQQGSQQLQGEVFELQLEEVLGAQFPYDQIGEVPKGIRGADVIQTVQTRSGAVCGKIVWESKNTKSWSPSWIKKLKEDQRQLKAEIAVLVTAVLPDGIESFGLMGGVWVTDMHHALSLAHPLREQLMKVQLAQVAHSGKAGKAEIVYDYLISNEFKQRIEVWVEYFGRRREELEKERRYFMKKWEKEEKEIFNVIQTTAGIYGDLQGLVGDALPRVSQLELE